MSSSMKNQAVRRASSTTTAVAVLHTILYDEDEFALKTFAMILEQAGFHVFTTSKSHALPDLIEVQRPRVIIAAMGAKPDGARAVFTTKEVAELNCIRVLLTNGGNQSIGNVRPPPQITLPKTEALTRLPTAIRQALVPNAKKPGNDPTELRERARKIIRAVARVGHESAEHCERLAQWSRRFGAMLGMSPEELLDIELGAMLHDVGQIGIGDAALLRNGPLTERERALMCAHPKLGADLLRETPQLHRAIPIVLNHHERFDGSGYPHRLAKDAIPFSARVFAVVDTYEALVIGRPWRWSMTHDEAIDVLRKAAGSQLDPLIVDAFAKLSKDEWKARVTQPALMRVAA